MLGRPWIEAMKSAIDLVIPTYNRTTALAVTLTSLCAQHFRDFRILVSDQSDRQAPFETGEIQAVRRVLELHGQSVEFHKNLPRRGLAQQRQFLLDHVSAPYVLYLDDDLILEPYVIGRMFQAIREEACGFVGCGVIGLSYLDDFRPHEQVVQPWPGPVQPETVLPDPQAWQRYRLHNAANLFHVQEQQGYNARLLPSDDIPSCKYRVAWIGGCVLYDTAKLRSVGGFEFWNDLPSAHAGEDVLAQLRVMARFGGCGLMPSGVYHQELSTTVDDRRVDAARVLSILNASSGSASSIVYDTQTGIPSADSLLPKDA